MVCPAVAALKVNNAVPEAPVVVSGFPPHCSIVPAIPPQMASWATCNEMSAARPKTVHHGQHHVLKELYEVGWRQARETYVDIVGHEGGTRVCTDRVYNRPRVCYTVTSRFVDGSPSNNAGKQHGNQCCTVHGGKARGLV